MEITVLSGSDFGGIQHILRGNRLDFRQATSPNPAALNAADLFQPLVHTLPYRRGAMTRTDGPRGMRA